MPEQVIYYEGKRVNIEKFLEFHPGGDKLNRYLGRDVTDAIEIYQHSKASYDIIKSGEVNTSNFDGYVDWSRPLFTQVGKLGKNYRSWVHSPVVIPMRFFASEWMEMQTKTQVHEVVIYWVPISLWLLTISWEAMINSGYGFVSSTIQIALLVFLGMIKWTLFEYLCHRWIFHSEPPEKSSFLITAHFMIHGVHHKVPFDKDRLLFPLVPATGIAFLLYSFYRLYMTTWMSVTVISGTILGYVFYDLTHHFLHYGSPKPGTYMYFMKRYHNQHHFSDTSKGFGISSNVWDEVFRTALKLRNLGFDLHWGTKP